MFRFLTPNKGSVQSDRGFIFRSKSRFTMEYVQGKHVLEVEVEHARRGDKWCVNVTSSSLSKWQPPFSDEPISSVDQERIRQNIKESLEFMGAIPIFY